MTGGKQTNLHAVVGMESTCCERTLAVATVDCVEDGPNVNANAKSNRRSHHAYLAVKAVGGLIKR